eukprot:12341234-Ditylum_brightwellii.AAC.1
MRTVLASTKQNNPGVKRAIILFPRPALRQLEQGQFHTYKLRTTPTDATSPIYELSVPFFNKRTPEEWIKFQRGPASYAIAKTLLKGKVLMVFKQAEIARGNHTVLHFNQCLNDMAKHVFLGKAGQIQKQYTQRNICFGKDLTVKEWVAHVQELNKYLKDFPAHKGNPTQPLDTDKLVDILEFRVPASWHREFTVQDYDPMYQGLC